MAKARKVPAFLDTYGPALRSIWGFWPEVIQLNRREAGIHLGKPHPSEDDLSRLLDEWAGHGVETVVVTDGERPALAWVAGQLHRAIPPPIAAVNPVGSGDCLLAGLVDARLAGLDPIATLQHGMGWRRGQRPGLGRRPHRPGRGPADRPPGFHRTLVDSLTTVFSRGPDPAGPPSPAIPPRASGRLHAYWKPPPPIGIFPS